MGLGFSGRQMRLAQNTFVPLCRCRLCIRVVVSSTAKKKERSVLPRQPHVKSKVVTQKLQQGNFFPSQSGKRGRGRWRLRLLKEGEVRNEGGRGWAGERKGGSNKQKRKKGRKEMNICCQKSSFVFSLLSLKVGALFQFRLSPSSSPFSTPRPSLPPLGAAACFCPGLPSPYPLSRLRKSREEKEIQSCGRGGREGESLTQPYSR